MGKTVFESIKDSKIQSHKLELIGFIEQLRSQAAPHLVKSQAPSSCVQGEKLLLWAETRKGVEVTGKERVVSGKAGPSLSSFGDREGLRDR